VSSAQYLWNLEHNVRYFHQLSYRFKRTGGQKGVPILITAPQGSKR
jgi:hypothetical protein